MASKDAIRKRGEEPGRESWWIASKES